MAGRARAGRSFVGHIVSVVETVLWVVSLASFAYFVVYSVSAVALIGLSLYETAFMKIDRGEVLTPPVRTRRPGITLVAPAYNTESLIVANAHSLLASDYQPLEVVIVDDGSAGGTPPALARAFALVELPVGDRFAIATEPVTNIYISRTDPRL